MVIILTGYGDMDSAVDALRLGADDFLQKPFDPNGLLYRVSNCLAKQNLQKEFLCMKNFYRYAVTAGTYGTIGKENTAKGHGIPWKKIS